ncbi:hypothetical protein HDV00_010953 [Rhizophlyctis rosea]|nr:hypothetical protein HDV00_010953 [Rhizophlyctis rosea]
MKKGMRKHRPATGSLSATPSTQTHTQPHKPVKLQALVPQNDAHHITAVTPYKPLKPPAQPQPRYLPTIRTDAGPGSDLEEELKREREALMAAQAERKAAQRRNAHAKELKKLRKLRQTEEDYTDKLTRDTEKQL